MKTKTPYWIIIKKLHNGTCSVYPEIFFNRKLAEDKLKEFNSPNCKIEMRWRWN